jgi:hypothetical protein
MPERDYSHRTLIEKLNIKDDAYPFLPNSSGSFATFTAIRRALSRVSNFAADLRLIYAILATL